MDVEHHKLRDTLEKTGHHASWVQQLLHYQTIIGIKERLERRLKGRKDLHSKIIEDIFQI